MHNAATVNRPAELQCVMLNDDAQQSTAPPTDGVFCCQFAGNALYFTEKFFVTNE